MRVNIKNEYNLHETTHMSNTNEIGRVLNDYSYNHDFGYRAPLQKSCVSTPSNDSADDSAELPASMPISVILESLKKDEETGVFRNQTVDSNDFEFLSDNFDSRDYVESTGDPPSDPLSTHEEKKEKNKIYTRKRSKIPNNRLKKIVISCNDPIWDVLEPILNKESPDHHGIIHSGDISIRDRDGNDEWDAKLQFDVLSSRRKDSYDEQNSTDETNGFSEKKSNLIRENTSEARKVLKLREGTLVKTLNRAYYNESSDNSSSSHGGTIRHVRGSQKNSVNSESRSNETHNHSERMRRLELRKGFLTLKATIPEIRNKEKIANVQVLQKATDTINYIRQKVHIKETMLNLQMKRKELLEAKLNRLRETISPFENYDPVVSPDEIVIN